MLLEEALLKWGVAVNVIFGWSFSVKVYLFYNKLIEHLFDLLKSCFLKNSTAIPHGGPSDDTSTQTWDDP